ncbi:hypothetical protein [Chryseolinea lacunae]|uniref:DUF4412 domain-containing protein n=1 Tax=Chryseolinea lacunae TaxID=2801331 RepID=A0ABS1KYU6_9BACT|nr:hypothetical protein [Chryseolinea lacunae]MBL0744626.1 hypothetical protein [Chryseolinea lacunae]
MRFLKLVLFLLVLAPIAHAQTVDDVIGGYVKYIGGSKKWTSAKTIISEGEYDYGGIVFPFTTYAKAPNLYKVIVPLNGKFYAQAFDGTEGWKVDGFKNETNPTPLSGPAALQLANEADVELIDVFVNYKAKGHTAVLEGKDTVDNTLCYKVTLTRKNGEKETWFFNTTSHQPVMRIAVSRNVEMGGALLNTHFSDYRDVSGLKIPFKTVSDANGQMILTVVVKKVVVNAPVDSKIFQP